MQNKKRISITSTNTRKGKTVTKSKPRKAVTKLGRTVSATSVSSSKGKSTVNSGKCYRLSPRVTAHRLPDIGSTVEMPVYKPSSRPADKPGDNGKKVAKQ